MSRVTDLLDDPEIRLGVTCQNCELFRLIPEDLAIGDTFYLAPCPKCLSMPQSLMLTDHGIEQTVH